MRSLSHIFTPLALPLTLGRNDSVYYVLWHWHSSWNGPLLYLITINLITFLAYAYDKRAAIRSISRTPERTLHLLALLGGSPAALFAQQTLRHKTRKRPFQWVYRGIVVIQVAAAVYWITGYAHEC